MGADRFHLVSNQPRRAAIEVLGTWPVPRWCVLIDDPRDLALIGEGARAFGLFYGPPGPLEQAWQAVKYNARLDLLSVEDLDKIAAWRLRNAPPGVIPAATLISRMAEQALAVRDAGGDVDGLVQLGVRK